MSMSEICPICGLPKELCVCTKIQREQQVITVSLKKAKWGKYVTVLRGFEGVDIKKIARELKTRLACGGSAKGDMIILQGNHLDRVKKELIRLGIPPENIHMEEY